MTIEEAKIRLKEIAALADDDEMAHIEEDRFREDVLTFIANSNMGEWSELCQLALDTNEISFDRWYA